MRLSKNFKLFSEAATRGARNGVTRNFRPETYNFIKKETLAQVFSCEFSKNTFLHRAPVVAASDKGLLRSRYDVWKALI